MSFESHKWIDVTFIFGVHGKIYVSQLLFNGFALQCKTRSAKSLLHRAKVIKFVIIAQILGQKHDGLKVFLKSYRASASVTADYE